MRTWDLIFFLFCSANRLSLSVVCNSLPFWHYSIIHIHSPSQNFGHIHSNTHKTLRNDNISWKPQRTSYYMRLACSSQVINSYPFRWMSDTWWGLCPLYLSFTPFLPFLSHLYIPLLSSLPFTSHLILFAPVTGCSDIDNSVFEDLLNFCVYGSWISVLPFLSNRSQ